MNNNKLKDIIKGYPKKFLQEILPPPIAALLATIDECETADDLKEKFDSIKQYVKETQKSIPPIPISVEVEYASIVIIYLRSNISNDEDLENTKKIQNHIIELLEDKLCSVEECEVHTNFIILQYFEPLLKEDWQCTISIMRDFFSEQFSTEIQAIAYI